MKRQLLLGCAVVMSICATAQAAPILNMGLILTNTNNVPLPTDGTGRHVVAPGQEFRVAVSATLANLEMSDTSHTDADTFEPLPAIQLGMQTLSFNLVYGGPPQAIVPRQIAGTPPGWAFRAPNGTLQLAQRQMVPNTLGPAKINLIADAQGNLNPSGGGYSNSNLNYEAGGAANPTADDALQNGIGTQVNVVRGDYVVNQAGGPFTISTNVTTANYFAEHPDTNNQLVALAVPTINNATVVIFIPEPGSISMLGMLASLVALSRRRSC